MGSDIQVTATTADALEAPPIKKSGIPVTLNGLTYTVKHSQRKEDFVILDGVTAAFRPGTLTALMGPSGCGKTTLLDVAAGRKTVGTIGGKILYGASAATGAALKSSVGYVEQFDTLVGELTVKQMLMYTAALRLPLALTAEQRRARVDEVISSLDLTSCEDTIIGNVLKRGISGGQAKRVNIALSLITRPSVLFLDEPTSGLDSFMANEVALALQALAKEGRTVVCTIHAPTAFAFSLFDDLLMLKAGRVLYGGPLSEAPAYFAAVAKVSPPTDPFARYSLPEWLVSITSPASSAAGTGGGGDGAMAAKAVDFAALYASSEAASTREALRASLVAAASADGATCALEVAAGQPGFCRQLHTLLAYRMVAHYKDGEFLGPRIGDKLIFGLLILSLYWGIGNKLDAQSIQSTASLLYFVSALCGYGAAAFVPSLTLDRPLFNREIADGCYSPLVYYLSKFVEEAFLCVFTSLLFAAIVFFGVDLQGSFFVFAATYYLTTSEHDWPEP